MVCRSPAVLGEPDVVPVALATDNGLTPSDSTASSTYYEPPTVVSVTPYPDSTAGAVVTIVGTKLDGLGKVPTAGKCKFVGVADTNIINVQGSGTIATCLAPAATGDAEKGPVHVQVAINGADFVGGEAAVLDKTRFHWKGTPPTTSPTAPSSTGQSDDAPNALQPPLPPMPPSGENSTVPPVPAPEPPEPPCLNATSNGTDGLASNGTDGEDGNSSNSSCGKTRRPDSPGSSVLVESVDVGGKTLKLQHYKGFEIGQFVRINPGHSTQETHLVGSC